MADPGMSPLGGDAPTEQMPTLGDAGELCEACAAPLAEDQRYCLNCGTRRAGPRVDYATFMQPAQGTTAQGPPANGNGAASVPVVVADGVAPVEGGKRERDYAPLAAVGGIAVLGLMLLVGVLIGKGDSGDSSAPAPVVVRGGGEEEAGGGSGVAAAGGEGEGLGLGGKGGAKASGKGDSQGGGGETGATQASTDDLESLNETSGKAYEEASKNLPNKIATPGAPPPIDKSEPPGGGEGKATTIE